MKLRRPVQAVLVLAVGAALPIVVQKVLLRLTGTVVRNERRHR